MAGKKKQLKKAKKLQATKPLISLNFTKIQTEYKTQ